MGGRAGVIRALRFELALNRVKQVIRLQSTTISDVFNGFETGIRALDVGNRDGTVEGNNRGIIDLEQLVVKRKDVRPIGGFEIFG